MAKKKRQTTETKAEDQGMTSVMDQVVGRVSEDSRSVTAGVDVQREEVASKVQTAPDEAPKVVYKDLRVPMKDDKVPDFRLHLEMHLQGERAVRMRRLLAGLKEEGSLQADGRNCVTMNDAIRWMIDQLAPAKTS